jgi:plastocyanin
MTAAASLMMVLALALPAPHAASHGVSIRDNRFAPRGLAVNRDAAVTWAWRGKHRHNVYFYSGSQRPRACSTRRRGTCTRRFRHRGRYAYICTLHGSMAGVIRVR